MEKQLFDAWADGQLVLVKLDHGFLPVGLRDQPFVDASFETARQLTAWPQIERQVRETMNAALVARQQEQAEPVAANLPPSGAEGGATPGAPPRMSREPQGNFADEIDEAPESAPAKPSSRSGLLPMLFLLGVAGLGAIGFAMFLNGMSGQMVPIAVGVAAAIVLVLLVAALLSRKPAARPANPPTKKSAARPAPAPAPAAPAEEEAAAPLQPALFVSYAHADSAQVTPVVEAVKDAGRPVWIDSGTHGGGILAGEGWAGEIVRAIKSAGGVVVMCSPRAFESDHIKREVYLADRYRKPMLPVFLEEASPPEDFEYFFASVQWLELFRLPEGERPQAIAKALGAV